MPGTPPCATAWHVPSGWKESTSASVAALDLSSNTAADDAASRHGLALAALSAARDQRPLRCAAPTRCSRPSPPTSTQWLTRRTWRCRWPMPQSLEAVLSNVRLRTRLAAVGSTIARDMFDKAVHVEPLADDRLRGCRRLAHRQRRCAACDRARHTFHAVPRRTLAQHRTRCAPGRRRMHALRPRDRRGGEEHRRTGGDGRVSGAARRQGHAGGQGRRRGGAPHRDVGAGRCARHYSRHPQACARRGQRAGDRPGDAERAP